MLANRDANSFNPARVFLVTKDSGLVKDIEAALRGLLPRALLTTVPEYPRLEWIRAMAGGPLPALIFVDANAFTGEAIAFVESISTQAAEYPLVAIHPSDNPDVILQFMRSGASDVLVRPFSEERLSELLRRLARSFGSAPAQAAGVYCIVPSKGACGATTLACNLAAAVHRGLKRRVLLMDLDSLAGMVAFQFKAHSSYSFLDALARIQGIDEDIWRGLVCHMHGIDLLLAPEDAETRPGHMLGVDEMIGFARSLYDVIVIDTGGPHGDASSSILRQSDRILLVTNNELAGLQAAQRALHHFDQLRLERSRVKVIVNRLRKGSGVGTEVIKAALHLESLSTIPEDEVAARKAVVEGKPLSPASAAGAAIGALAGELLGEVPKGTPAKVSGLRGLLAMLRR